MRRRDPEADKKERLVARYIAARVRACRLEMGLSQQELGHCCGLGQATISRMEKGGRMPRMTTLAQVAIALGTTLHQMLPVGHIHVVKAA